MTTHGITTDVSLAANVLLHGGIIGLPTETVYGLAALALDENAVHRIFDTKGRPRNHPLIVHLASTRECHQWGIFNDVANALAEAFWPGPLTLLVPRTPLVPDWVTGGRDTVALRVPSHPVAQELLAIVGTGVVAPSANKFGKVSPTSARHVLEDLGDDVDLILDGGSCAVGIESTIVECTDTFQILRPGQLSEEDIAKVVNLSVSATSGISRAPGMLESHYAPEAQIILTDTLEEAEKIADVARKDTKVYILHYDNVTTFAERLYEDLRLADAQGCKLVVAVRAPATGIGIAINDRLNKASAKR